MTEPPQLPDKADFSAVLEASELDFHERNISVMMVADMMFKLGALVRELELVRHNKADALRGKKTVKAAKDGGNKRSANLDPGTAKRLNEMHRLIEKYPKKSRSWAAGEAARKNIGISKGANLKLLDRHKGTSIFSVFSAAQMNQQESLVRDTMVDEMSGSRRLSTTFRFAPSSSILDNRAQRDLLRMVRYFAETGPKTVYIVGFADAGGSFTKNQFLSQQRARQVADQIAALALGGELDGVTLAVRGYSELSPVACNDVVHGRAINRRVEIWVN